MGVCPLMCNGMKRHLVQGITLFLPFDSGKRLQQTLATLSARGSRKRRWMGCCLPHRKKNGFTVRMPFSQNQELLAGVTAAAEEVKC